MEIANNFLQSQKSILTLIDTFIKNAGILGQKHRHHQSVQFVIGEEWQNNINVLDNGTLISPTPPLTFTSSNETVCTISSNGLITALNNVNNCLITVSLTSDSSVSDTINIIVIEMPQDNYTYSLTSTSLPLPDTEIIINQTKQYQ